MRGLCNKLVWQQIVRSKSALDRYLRSQWYASIEPCNNTLTPCLLQYLIMNLGISPQFGFVDFANLVFPSVLKLDYVRVYQDPNNLNWGCDPPNFPTQAYINTWVPPFSTRLGVHHSNRCFGRPFRYMKAYTDPNLTTWRNDFGQPFPKNSFLETC